jgi:hypothetical protein
MPAVTSPAFRRELGDGLVLRWSTASDTERIAMLHSLVHRERAEDPPNTNIIRVIRRLMQGDHPLMGPQDFGMIEDTSKEGNPVVACTCLWKHAWTYEGIPFSVGRPEMVATDPAYRDRGLIRTLFELIHARSETEGDLVQAITGINYFYRQFGYEYALELENKRVTSLALLPKARDGEPEPFTLREATRADIPVIAALYRQRRASSIVSESITDQQWLYEIETWKAHPELSHAFQFQVIVDAAGQMVGFVTTDVRRWGNALGVWLLEFIEGMNLQTTVPSVLRALHTYGLTLDLGQPAAPPLSELSFALGSTHPLYDVFGEDLARAREPPYAWYVRVKELPAFLRHLAPALERRLARSPIVGHTGEIKLDFYRGGLRLVFERGRLIGAEPWRVPLYASDASGGFPPLVFLQVLFGHRSIEALRQAYPDVWVSDEARMVLRTLFPTRPSFVFSW